MFMLFLMYIGDVPLCTLEAKGIFSQCGSFSALYFRTLVWADRVEQYTSGLAREERSTQGFNQNPLISVKDQEMLFRRKILVQSALLLLLLRSYLNILYWWHVQRIAHLRQLPATMWYLGIGSISLMLRRYLQTGVETHANTGRPRITPYGKWPDKCVEVWISDHSSEKSLRVAMVSEEPFVCQIPSQTVKLSNFACLKPRPPLFAKNKQANKQKNKKIYIAYGCMHSFQRIPPGLHAW